jgi:uncharacterized protein (TIGR04255 family)
MREERVQGVLPSYRNPPVTEVVAGVMFEQAISGFFVPHIGLFWNRVIREFPEAQHFNPLAPVGGEPRWLDGVTGLPLPRVWLISQAKTEVIQLQGDCFYFNWRKLKDADLYPRFERVLSGFDTHLADFVAFLREHRLPEPKPQYCELTYVNHVPHGEAWKSMRDVEHILKDFCWSDTGRFFSTPKAISWTSTFDMREDSGTLTAKFSQVKRIPEMKPMLRLELTARGKGKATSLNELRPWFDIAHEAIVVGFTDLTTPEAQEKLWEREQ